MVGWASQESMTGFLKCTIQGLTLNHLLGVFPANNESAGHQREGRVRKGNLHLKTMLVQAAHAAIRHRPSYLHAKFLRLKTRRGPKRAAMAIAHKILLVAYQLLSYAYPVDSASRKRKHMSKLPKDH